MPMKLIDLRFQYNGDVIFIHNPQAGVEFQIPPLAAWQINTFEFAKPQAADFRRHVQERESGLSRL
jgi:hypothetical protein